MLSAGGAFLRGVALATAFSLRADRTFSRFAAASSWRAAGPRRLRPETGEKRFSLRAASRARTFLRAPGAVGERKDGRSIAHEAWTA